jgi:hypothetical protein
MQNARVIQLGSSGVKVTRSSASFEEAFGGYSGKKGKQKFSNFVTQAQLDALAVASTSATANLPVVTDAPRDYKILKLYGQTTAAMQKVGGGSKSFPTDTPLKMVRSYKVLNGNPIEVKLVLIEDGATYIGFPTMTKDVATNLMATSLPINPIAPTTTGTTTGTTTTTTGTTGSLYLDTIATLTPSPISRYTDDKPLMPLFQGFYKVVNDVFGQRDGAFASKKFLKDSILEGYLQTFDNPTTGGKSGYWVVQAEVPTTVGNATTTTASPSNNPSNVPVTNVATSTASSGTATGTATSGGTTTSSGTTSGTSTGTQTSPNPSATPQAKSSATGMTMVKFKLPLYALIPAVTTTYNNTNTGGGTNEGVGNYDPNQGGGTNQGGGVYTGGGNSSADLDALNAQIEAQQMAQYQQQGGGQQQNNTSLEDLNAQVDAENQAQMMQQGSSGYEPTQDELMVDIDTNYAPDTEIESSFDGYANSNAMETMIKDLCTKIAWNKEMAEMLKMKKGVDKSELKAEYVAKVDRVNELLRELKSYETPANREYIQKMLNYCDMMRPSKKRTMPKQMVIQNTNPKVISLGNTTPSEFKNDLGNTIMEDENSSFMGEVIDYSAFNGSSTSTALIGVGIGAVLGIIGIVVINKMKK